jgi:hypothetical protein
VAEAAAAQQQQQCHGGGGGGRRGGTGCIGNSSGSVDRGSNGKKGSGGNKGSCGNNGSGGNNNSSGMVSNRYICYLVYVYILSTDVCLYKFISYVASYLDPIQTGFLVIF